MTVREQIIVLKKQAFSESDLIIRGLNKQGAQISFIAKGALKSKKRFTGGILDPGSYIELEYRASQKPLKNIQRAWFLEDFLKLRSSYQRLELAIYFLNITLQVSKEGENCEELFYLLGNALKQAETSQHLVALKIFFQTKVLFLQGVLSQELSVPFILKKPLKEHHRLGLKSPQQNQLLLGLEKALKKYLEH